MIPLPLDNFFAAAVQAGILALVGAPLPRLFGIWSPRARLAYWRALMAVCVLLPLLAPRVAVVTQATPPIAAAADTVSVSAAAPDVGRRASASPAGSVRSWSPVGVGQVLIAGILARLAWLALGLFTLTRLRRSASRLWPRPVSVDEAVALAGTDAEFLVSGRALRPMTFGLLRPVVLVPNDFQDLTPVQQKAVACHELLHVGRGDWLRTAADELVRTLAWFHPAAWWLTGQIHLAREQLVDEQVVRRLGSRRPYLDTLLHLASSDRRGALLPASLFLRHAHLPQRVALLVKEVRMSRTRLVLSFLSIALLLAVCGRATVAAFPLRTVVDQPAVLASLQGSRPGGAVGAPPGSLPGQDIKRELRDLAVEDLRRELRDLAQTSSQTYPRKLQDVRPVFPETQPTGDWPWLFEVTLDASGNVSDVTSLSAATNRIAEAVEEAVRQWRFSPPPTAPFRLLVGFNLGAGIGDPDQPPVLVGGDLKAPVKVFDVRPVYPSAAAAAGVQGVVVLEARIDANGWVSEARVLRSIPMLDRAALEAVLGWKYQTPGFPIEMTVTMNFTLDTPVRARVQGGVSGGVVGGVTGGIVGGAAGGVTGGAGVTGTAAWAPGHLRAGGTIKAPAKVVDVRPVYPADALEARVQGVVIVEAKIRPDGRVEDARILRSIPLLDEAALAAVRQWVYTPTLLNGKPIGVVMAVTVSFTLE